MKKFFALWMITMSLFMASSYAMKVYRSQTLVGIGATLEKQANGWIHVRALISGAPAERAGIRPGDLISEVRSLPGSQVVRVQALSLPEVVALIRGPLGVPVELLVHRGSSEPEVVSVVRDQFEVEEEHSD